MKMDATATVQTKPKPRQRPNEHGEQRLLDYRAGSRFLGVGYWVWRQMVLSGVFPCIRIGKKVLVDRQDVEAWIAREKSLNT
jgi:excisionase family DNA binding protein